ncbi:MAG: TspO/MBR family protein [Mycoplasmatota bacterium]
MKKILKFILILFVWFVPSMFVSFDSSYYNSLNLPSYTPNNYIFPIVWSILYILISINIFKITEEYELNELKEYKNILIFNYITNMLFSFFFISLQSPFLAFVDSLFVFLSSLFLYYESKDLNKQISSYLIPYVIWTFFATFLSLSIYFLNL